MKRVKFLYLFISLLISSVFVYSIKDADRNHVMKFTGDFSIVYEDTKLLSEDINFTETFITAQTPENINYNYTTQKLPIVDDSLVIQDTYLFSSPRAPPFVS